jgi:hypothetical protein
MTTVPSVRRVWLGQIHGQPNGFDGEDVHQGAAQVRRYTVVTHGEIRSPSSAARRLSSVQAASITWAGRYVTEHSGLSGMDHRASVWWGVLSGGRSLLVGSPVTSMCASVWISQLLDRTVGELGFRLASAV